MAKLQTDELNSFNAEDYIRDFFEPMQISDERKEDRVETSKEVRDALLFLFALISAYSEYTVNWDVIEAQFGAELTRIIAAHGFDSAYMNAYIFDKVAEFISATRDNIGSDPYWLSDERATYESVNEANDIIGYKEMRKAIEDGYTRKKWVTQNDSRVRYSHRKMEGKAIPIREFFVLEKGRMLYPHDFVNCPEETYNCRCALIFL